MASFPGALNGQIAYEFAASQQYIAIAAYYDSEALPQLASRPWIRTGPGTGSPVDA